MLLLIIIIPFCIFLFGQPVLAETNWAQKIKPTTMQVQYAGNLGLVSVGIGKTFNQEKIASYLIYGYLPKNVNGVEAHTLAWKTTMDIKKINWHGTHTIYTGLTLMRYYANHAYLSLPDFFPKGYYGGLPMALHTAPLIGNSFSWHSEGKQKKNTSFVFLEISALDIYLINFYHNISSMNFFDVCSLSFGIRHFF